MPHDRQSGIRSSFDSARPEKIRRIADTNNTTPRNNSNNNRTATTTTDKDKDKPSLRFRSSGCSDRRLKRERSTELAFDPDPKRTRRAMPSNNFSQSSSSSSHPSSATRENKAAVSSSSSSSLSSTMTRTPESPSVPARQQDVDSSEPLPNATTSGQDASDFLILSENSLTLESSLADPKDKSSETKIKSTGGTTDKETRKSSDSIPAQQKSLTESWQRIFKRLTCQNPFIVSAQVSELLEFLSFGVDRGASALPDELLVCTLLDLLDGFKHRVKDHYVVPSKTTAKTTASGFELKNPATSSTSNRFPTSGLPEKSKTEDNEDDDDEDDIDYEEEEVDTDSDRKKEQPTSSARAASSSSSEVVLSNRRFVDVLNTLLGAARGEPDFFTESFKGALGDDEGVNGDLDAFKGECAIDVLGPEALAERAINIVSCLNFLLEAYPNLSKLVCTAGGIPILCEQLQDLTFVEVAERVMILFSDFVIDEYPLSVLLNGGMESVLQFVDFLPLASQSKAIKAAEAMICAFVTNMSFAETEDSDPAAALKDPAEPDGDAFKTYIVPAQDKLAEFLMSSDSEILVNTVRCWDHIVRYLVDRSWPLHDATNLGAGECPIQNISANIELVFTDSIVKSFANLLKNISAFNDYQLVHPKESNLSDFSFDEFEAVSPVPKYSQDKISQLSTVQQLKCPSVVFSQIVSIIATVCRYSPVTASRLVDEFGLSLPDFFSCLSATAGNPCTDHLVGVSAVTLFYSLAASPLTVPSNESRSPLLAVPDQRVSFWNEDETKKIILQQSLSAVFSLLFCILKMSPSSSAVSVCLSAVLSFLCVCPLPVSVDADLALKHYGLDPLLNALHEGHGVQILLAVNIVARMADSNSDVVVKQLESLGMGSLFSDTGLGMDVLEESKTLCLMSGKYKFRQNINLVNISGQISGVSKYIHNKLQNKKKEPSNLSVISILSKLDDQHLNLKEKIELINDFIKTQSASEVRTAFLSHPEFINSFCQYLLSSSTQSDVEDVMNHLFISLTNLSSTTPLDGSIQTILDQLKTSSVEKMAKAVVACLETLCPRLDNIEPVARQEDDEERKVQSHSVLSSSVPLSLSSIKYKKTYSYHQHNQMNSDLPNCFKQAWSPYWTSMRSDLEAVSQLRIAALPFKSSEDKKTEDNTEDKDKDTTADNKESAKVGASVTVYPPLQSESSPLNLFLRMRKEIGLILVPSGGSCHGWLKHLTAKYFKTALAGVPVYVVPQLCVRRVTQLLNENLARWFKLSLRKDEKLLYKLLRQRVKELKDIRNEEKDKTKSEDRVGDSDKMVEVVLDKPEHASAVKTGQDSTPNEVPVSVSGKDHELSDHVEDDDEDDEDDDDDDHYDDDDEFAEDEFDESLDLDNDEDEDEDNLNYEDVMIMCGRTPKSDMELLLEDLGGEKFVEGIDDSDSDGDIDFEMGSGDNPFGFPGDEDTEGDEEDGDMPELDIYENGMRSSTAGSLRQLSIKIKSKPATGNAKTEDKTTPASATTEAALPALSLSEQIFRLRRRCAFYRTLLNNMKVATNKSASWIVNLEYRGRILAPEVSIMEALCTGNPSLVPIDLHSFVGRDVNLALKIEKARENPSKEMECSFVPLGPQSSLLMTNDVWDIDTFCLKHAGSMAQNQDDENEDSVVDKKVKKVESESDTESVSAKVYCTENGAYCMSALSSVVTSMNTTLNKLAERSVVAGNGKKNYSLPLWSVSHKLTYSITPILVNKSVEVDLKKSVERTTEEIKNGENTLSYEPEENFVRLPDGSVDTHCRVLVSDDRTAKDKEVEDKDRATEDKDRTTQDKDRTTEDRDRTTEDKDRTVENKWACTSAEMETSSIDLNAVFKTMAELARGTLNESLDIEGIKPEMYTGCFSLLFCRESRPEYHHSVIMKLNEKYNNDYFLNRPETDKLTVSHVASLFVSRLSILARVIPSTLKLAQDPFITAGVRYDPDNVACCSSSSSSTSSGLVCAQDRAGFWVKSLLVLCMLYSVTETVRDVIETAMCAEAVKSGISSSSLVLSSDAITNARTRKKELRDCLRSVPLSLSVLKVLSQPQLVLMNKLKWAKILCQCCPPVLPFELRMELLNAEDLGLPKYLHLQKQKFKDGLLYIGFGGNAGSAKKIRNQMDTICRNDPSSFVTSGEKTLLLPQTLSVLHDSNKGGNVRKQRDVLRQLDFNPIVPRVKLRLARTQLLLSAFKIMFHVRSCAIQSGTSPTLDIEYHGEEGTGSGPTLEFYSEVATKLTELKSPVQLFVEDSRDFLGAFPKPIKSDFRKVEQRILGPPPFDLSGPTSQPDSSSNDLNTYLPHLLRLGMLSADTDAIPVGSLEDFFGHDNLETKIFRFWKLIGELCAKNLQDQKRWDLEFNPFFFKLLSHNILNGPPHCSFSDLAMVNPPLYYGGIKIRDFALSGKDVSTLGITFVVPGTDPVFELVPGGQDRVVNNCDIEIYLQRLAQAVLWDGIKIQIVAFKFGFGSLLPLECLSYFEPSEISSKLLSAPRAECEDAFWTEAHLSANIIPEHGYTRESPPYKYFIKVLSELPPDQRKQFLKFTTGTSILPSADGFGGFVPLMTVVKRSCEDSSQSSVDLQLPSVMTCSNYIKLPQYSSASALKDRLYFAFTEGANAFSLS